MRLKQKAIRFIILMGMISLFADITYEGARSITGPFLATLGASSATVGIIVGLGELAGYGIRVLSGIVADKTSSYWLFTFVGYTINLLAIPLLALAGNWPTAAFLMIMERLGKGLRTPARDVMLSFAAKQVGRGFGFGLHEALDQIGAICGPLFVSVILFLQHQYTAAFAWLAIPALIAIGFLITARISFSHPEKMEIEEKKEFQTKSYSRKFWLYVIGTMFVGMGFIDFALLAYHFQKSGILSPLWIPLIYALTMAVDGISALGMGKIFDLKGISTLTFVIAATSIFAPLVLFGGFWTIFVGMMLWGIGLGAQESIMRSSIALLVSAKKRGAAYGILYLGFGLSWFFGSMTIGYLYDISLNAVAIFSISAQLLGALSFFIVRRDLTNRSQ